MVGYDEVLGVVLCGGRARRMGGEVKPLLWVGGETILSRILVRLGSLDVVLNVNGDASRFERYEMEVLPDVVGGRVGPLAGVLTAMERAGGDYGYVLSVPGDAPFLPVDLLERLGGAMVEGVDIVAASSGGRVHPVVALWRVGLAGDLRTALVDEGVRKIMDFTERFAVEVVPWEVGVVDPFMNLNTYADLELAMQVS